MDVTYWETLAQFIRAQMARTRLRDMHQENLRRKLEYLRQAQGIVQAEPLFPSASTEQEQRNTELKSLGQIIRPHGGPAPIESEVDFCYFII